MAFSKSAIAANQTILSNDVLQIINALDGTAGFGQQISLTDYSNVSNYALTVKNNSTGGALLIQSSAGATLATFKDSAITLASVTAFGLRDTTAAFDVTLAATSTSATITAGRTITLDVGNVAHTIALGTTANTITFPNAASGTVPLLNLAQSFTAVQTFTGAVFSTSVSSTTALATPAAYVATTGTFFASTVSGATLQGFGTTGDVTLKNRAGTDVIVVTANTLNVTMAGALTVTAGGATITGTITSLYGTGTNVNPFVTSNNFTTTAGGDRFGYNATNVITAANTYTSSGSVYANTGLTVNGAITVTRHAQVYAEAVTATVTGTLTNHNSLYLGTPVNGLTVRIVDTAVAGCFLTTGGVWTSASHEFNADGTLWKLTKGAASEHLDVLGMLRQIDVHVYDLTDQQFHREGVQCDETNCADPAHHWRVAEHDRKGHIGYRAEQLHRLSPMLSRDGLGVDALSMSAFNTAALQLHDARIVTLERELATLRGRLN